MQVIIANAGPQNERANAGKEICKLGKKKHSGRTPGEPAGTSRKLSEIVKEMALRLLKDPDAVPSAPAAQTALLLATAAWNSPLEDPDLTQKAIRKIVRGQASPWEELVSTDNGRLIRDLVAYKEAHYPNDRRRIIAAEMNPEGKFPCPLG